MKFKQFYLGCLSHASYYISSNGEAAVIDPQRDIEQYLAEADANGDKIKYVFETHSHADFVSGHVELAAKTGAEIVFGAKAKTEFPTHKATDGDILALGNIRLTIYETPGHTPEGIVVLAEDANSSEPAKLFTGDTLFIGDVGRPDLIGSEGFTSEEMASMLYDSLHEKIMPLPDTTEVYPAHGAGSLCGRSLSKETSSTLGEQKRTNYALRPMPREEFVKLVASDQPEVPAYFKYSASENLRGASSISELARPKMLSSDEIAKFAGTVIDVRPNTAFGSGHVRGAINIGLSGQFASWAGTLIPVGTPIAIFAQGPEEIDEAVLRLARVGHETVTGAILDADFTGERSVVEQIPVDEVSRLLGDRAAMGFIDVRRPAEYAAAHATTADNFPLDSLNAELDALDRELPTYVICQSGYRSSAGASILEKAGFRKVYNVTGGTKAWLDAGLPMEAPAPAN